MKMSVCWMAVMLVLFLWTPDTVESGDSGESGEWETAGGKKKALKPKPVDPANLAKIVTEIQKYGPKPVKMFSVAACMPMPGNTNIDNIVKYIYSNDYEVKEKKKQVELGNKVVVAKYIEDTTNVPHTEYRVAEQLEDLKAFCGNNDDFLLFYVYASPCFEKCTNPQKNNENILEMIKVMKEWPSYAFVFSKPYDQNTDGKVQKSLQHLAGSIAGKKIFRCDNGVCTPCFKSGDNVNVVATCYTI